MKPRESDAELIHAAWQSISEMLDEEVKAETPAAKELLAAIPSASSSPYLEACA